MPNNNYAKLYNGLQKRAASLLTPEAMAAVEQPAPMPAPAAPAPVAAPAPAPAAPMDPAAMGGAPMAPAQGMPPAGGIDPAMLQDPGFVAFLQQGIGVMVDPASGTVTDPTGAPVPPEMIQQFYQAYQQQAQGAGQPAPASPEQGAPDQGAPSAEDVQDPQAAMLNDFASAVVSAVEAILQDQISALEKKISAIMDKLDTMKLDIQDKDKEKQMAQEQGASDPLSAELERELQQPAAGAGAPVPVLDALIPKQGSAQPAPSAGTGKRTLMDILSNGK